MSSVERYAVERSIRRLEHAHQQLAAALVLAEEVLADQRRVLASDEASRAAGWRTAAERRVSIPAQREGECS
jgi:hypothetical protein